MSTHKHLNKICSVAVVLALLLTVVLINGEALGLQAADQVMGYEDRLFDTGTVHTIDIVMDDWESFLATCQQEQYAVCTVVIDGEAYDNVGIRGKGNTSLSTVSSMDSDRYSFKIEFDQYQTGNTYYGLDKLCLNNLIQDNTMMKDHLVYEMMRQFGAAAPLSSYAYLTVNGQDWGLYLAVESLEESFLKRNYGSDHGQLYKPDSMDMGGGRGNGKDFEMNWEEGGMPQFPGGDAMPAFGEMPQMEMPERGGFGGMGSDDVKLKYIDDNPSSYENIFANAKTETTGEDQTRLIRALQRLGEGNPEDSVDMEAVMRYFVVHNFVVNGDSYTGSMIHNYYLYEKDGILSMLPWDYNLAFGTFQSADAAETVNDPIDAPLSVTGDGDRPMMDWILNNEEYLRQYHQLFAEFLEQVDAAAIAEETAALIAPYVEKDPTKFCTVEEFETAVSVLGEFCRLRTQSVRAQLDESLGPTDQGQDAQPVDASHITLSDMGTMNMGGGFGRGDREAFAPTQMPTWEGEEKTENTQNVRPMPQDGTLTQQQMRGSSQWLLLGISVLVLAVGLIVVLKYKRYG